MKKTGTVNKSDTYYYLTDSVVVSCILPDRICSCNLMIIYRGFDMKINIKYFLFFALLATLPSFTSVSIAEDKTLIGKWIPAEIEFKGIGSGFIFTFSKDQRLSIQFGIIIREKYFFHDDLLVVTYNEPMSSTVKSRFVYKIEDNKLETQRITSYNPRTLSRKATFNRRNNFTQNESKSVVGEWLSVGDNSKDDKVIKEYKSNGNSITILASETTIYSYSVAKDEMTLNCNNEKESVFKYRIIDDNLHFSNPGEEEIIFHKF